MSSAAFEDAIGQWILTSLIPNIEAFFGPFVDTLGKRFVFSAVFIGIAKILQIISAMFWSSLAKDPDIQRFDNKKRHHWRLFACLVGYLILVWPYEAGIGESKGFTFNMLICLADKKSYALIVFFAVVILFIVALRRSLQYLWYKIGIGYAANVWFDYMQWMGYGMGIAQIWEAALRLIFNNASSGFMYFCLFISHMAHIILLFKCFIDMFRMFTSSLFTDKFLLELEKEERIKRYKTKTTSGGFANGDIVFPEQSQDVSYPDVLYDSWENQYRLQSSSYDHADYYCSATGDTVQFWASDFEDGLPSGWRTGS